MLVSPSWLLPTYFIVAIISGDAFSGSFGKGLFKANFFMRFTLGMEMGVDP